MSLEEKVSLELIQQIQIQEAAAKATIKPNKPAEKTYQTPAELFNAISVELFDNRQYSDLTEDEKVLCLSIAKDQAENRVAEVVGFEDDKIFNLLGRLEEQLTGVNQGTSVNTSPRSHSVLSENHQMGGKF